MAGPKLVDTEAGCLRGTQLMLAGARNRFLLTIQQQQPQRACQLSKATVRDQLVRRQVLELKDGDKLVFTKPGYGWARYRASNRAVTRA